MILRHATQEFIYSTKHTFASKYYKELPPSLKMKLVQAILPSMKKELRSFFHDMNTIAEEATDPHLLRKIATSLHVKIFDDFESVIRVGSQPD